MTQTSEVECLLLGVDDKETTKSEDKLLKRITRTNHQSSKTKTSVPTGRESAHGRRSD